MCVCVSLLLCVCQAAERDWEEKRASLTQFSAQDINRLLEETQAELMKAIPDLDFAARHINKPAVPPKPQITIPISSTTATSPAAVTSGTTAAAAATATSVPAPGPGSAPSGDQQPGKVQLAAQKLNSLEGGGSHRGSGECVCVALRCVRVSEWSSWKRRDTSFPLACSRPQRGPVPHGETLQVSAPSPATQKLPVCTRPHHQPHWRGGPHLQEHEGEKVESVEDSLLLLFIINFSLFYGLNVS